MTTDLYRYVYDEAGQLVREDNIPANVTYTWQYDKGGNIVSKKIYIITSEGVAPTSLLGELPYTYSTGIWKDQLASFNGQDISYDAAGNPSSYMGSALTWTMGRQLESFNKSGVTTTYKYNDSGIRTSKTVGTITTDYALNGTQILAQTENGVRTDFRYDGNGKLIALRYNGTEYYYVTNILGDITGLIDSTGTIVVEYIYSAWGQKLSVTGTLATTLGQANPFRYRGYYYDVETELYYLQSRYYDPNTGRFINADDTSILQVTQDELTGDNLYVYCGNCPIMKVDLTGYWPNWKKIGRSLIDFINSTLDATQVLLRFKFPFNIPVVLFTIATQLGILDKLLSKFGFEKDRRGIYHVNQNAWQKYFGYNDFYDWVFDRATDMKFLKFPFKVGKIDYMIWMWKGDYINLGAGGEVGIYYYNLFGHMLCATRNAMKMTLNLFDKRTGPVFSWSPSSPNWWITGFNPKLQRVKALDLIMSGSIDFWYQPDLWKAFFDRYDGNPYWKFIPSRRFAYFTW